MSQVSWMNKQELDYLFNSEYAESHSGLSDSMNIPRFTISDLNVTHRDASYWDKKGVLPKLQTKGTTRRKYTLKQAVWIKLIQQLRGFDISLNQIKNYKECILSEGPKIDELLENDEISKMVEELVKKSGNLEEYKELLKDPDFLKSMQEDSIDVFEIIILYVIVFKRDISYIVFREEGCFPYCYDKHNLFTDEIEGFDEMMTTPHLVLSISEVIGELIVDWSEEKWFSSTSLLTLEEEKIFDHLRSKEVDELIVYKYNGKPERLVSVTNKENVSLENFAQYIMKNGYQSIKVTTRKGNVINFKNEISIKLNK